jgi:hypothetical protein
MRVNILGNNNCELSKSSHRSDLNSSQESTNVLDDVEALQTTQVRAYALHHSPTLPFFASVK